MKNYEQYKRLVRFLTSAILLSLQMVMYWYVWINYYNPLMDLPYNRTGNWLIVAVYGLLMTLFSGLYGGQKLGFLKTTNLIYSQVLATLCTNGIIYLQITLLTKHFQTIIPLALMIAVAIFLDVAWGYMSNRIYRKLYPPRKVLLVYGERPITSLMGKLHTRTDRFIIGDLIHISEEMETIKERINQYGGIIICDVPSSIRNQLLKYCYGKSIRTYTIPKISDIIVRSAESFHMFDTPLMLSRNNGPSIEQLFLKRIMDIVIAFSALVFLSPILVITAIAIKIYDGGPVLFCQKRCTKNGEIFHIYKFRSMIVDAERGQSVPAINHDPRITPIGNFIRKTRIDELPQLFNILKGDMSVVGPRPERIEHVYQYTEEIPEFIYRLKVKGGLTGYAQVYGKYNTTAYDKLKLDLMYIQNYSLLLDIEIIFKTIKILFMRESTEGFDKEISAALAEKSKAKNL